MYLAAAILAFALYVANVALGAFAAAAFLGETGEMIVLFVASIFFVIEILKREASRKNTEN